jgi:O-acetylserine/cysteine efflux transporter
MKPIHSALAVLVAIIWGIAFVVSKVGLESFTPSQLTTLRFMVAAVAALWIPRPKISWPMLVSIGLTVFAGQFLLQFFGIAQGMPAGLTAVVVQTQAIFTVLFAALVMGDKPTLQQVGGMFVAFTGLIMISMTLGSSVPLLAFALTLASAISWASGNVLVKRLPKTNTLHLMVWASLVPPLPALVVSFLLDGPQAFLEAMVEASWLGLMAPIYLGVMASVFAYAVWGYLLQKYSTGDVAPFAMLSPAVGAIMSALVFGESFGLIRFAGIACMVVGLLIVIMPRQRLVFLLKRVGLS